MSAMKTKLERITEVRKTENNTSLSVLSLKLINLKSFSQIMPRLYNQDLTTGGPDTHASF